MENCLVTKLKGSVDNDELEVFGKARFYVNSDSQFGFNLEITPILHVTEGNINLVKDNITTSIGTWAWHPEIQVWKTTGDGKGYIDVPKYDITRFYMQKNCYCPKLAEVAKYTNLQMLYLTPFSSDDNLPEYRYRINLADLFANTPNLQYCASYNGGLYGDMSSVSNLRLINAIFISNTDFTGKFSEVGKSPVLKFMSTVNGSSGAAWTIEEFVANQRNAGVTEGSVTAYAIADWSKLSFDNQIVLKETWDESNHIISWTASTITAIGKTINA